MTKIVYGERIGKQARLAIGCSAIIWDATKQRLLLTRRADNGQWCLPSGRMEPGESIAETCAREVPARPRDEIARRVHQPRFHHRICGWQ